MSWSSSAKGQPRHNNHHTGAADRPPPKTARTRHGKEQHTRESATPPHQAVATPEVQNLSLSLNNLIPGKQAGGSANYHPGRQSQKRRISLPPLTWFRHSKAGRVAGILAVAAVLTVVAVIATTVIPLSSAADSPPQFLPAAPTPESDADVYARIAERQLSTAAAHHEQGQYQECAQVAKGIAIGITVSGLRSEAIDKVSVRAHAATADCSQRDGQTEAAREHAVRALQIIGSTGHGQGLIPLMLGIANATPTPEPTLAPTPEPASTATPTATPEPTPTPTLEPTPTLVPTATPTPEPTSTPAPTPAPTPTPVPSLESRLKWHGIPIRNANATVGTDHAVVGCYIDPERGSASRKTLLFGNTIGYEGPPDSSRHYLEAQTHPRRSLSHGRCYRFWLIIRQTATTDWNFCRETNPYRCRPEDSDYLGAYQMPVYQLDPDRSPEQLPIP